MQSLNIWEAAKDNTNFRKVLYTNSHSQLVFVSGTCRAEIDGEQKDVSEGEVVVVPAGSTHNFANTGSEPLKLFTVYAPAEHPDGTIHATKAEAEEAEHVSELRNPGKQKKFVKMGKSSVDEFVTQAEKDFSLAKNVVERIKNGEAFELRFNTLELAKAVNSELKTSGILEEGQISDADISAAKILRHYLEYPQDFSNITFPSIDIMQSFFKILPYGKTAVHGILEAGASEPIGSYGIKGETEDLEGENKNRNAYITKPIFVQPTAEQNQNEIPTKRPEEFENKKAA